MLERRVRDDGDVRETVVGVLAAIGRVWLATVILWFATPGLGHVLAARVASQGQASPGAEPRTAVSPDGRFRVQVDGEAASQQLLLVNVSTGDAVVIHNAPGTTYLDVSFSADGDAIRFREARAGQPTVRYEIPALGGPPRRIADDAPDVAPPGQSVVRPAKGLYLFAMLGGLLTTLALAYAAVRRLGRRPPVVGGETAAGLTPPVAPSDVGVNSSSVTEFTMWVRDPNPDKAYLLALLVRICREHPQDIPAEFRAYHDGERSRRRLSYRTSPNRSKGGTDISWVLTRSKDPDGGV